MLQFPGEIVKQNCRNNIGVVCGVVSWGGWTINLWIITQTCERERAYQRVYNLNSLFDISTLFSGFINCECKFLFVFISVKM